MARAEQQRMWERQLEAARRERATLGPAAETAQEETVTAAAAAAAAHPLRHSLGQCSLHLSGTYEQAFRGS